MFPQGQQYETFSEWRDKGLITAVFLYDVDMGSPKPFTSFAEEFHIHNHHFLHISQVTDFIRKTCLNKHTRFQTSLIDKLLNKQKYSIEDIYRPLNALLTKSLHHTSVQSWSKNLN